MPKGPHTRYIYDRCNGTSVYKGESRRPCCYLCYVPPPVFVWPRTCEQCRPCQCVGRVGCCGREYQKSRTGVFTVLLLFNFYALALTIYSNFAISDDVTILERANLAKGVTFFQIANTVVPLRAYVGLNYIAIRDRGGVLGTSFAAAAADDDEGESIYSWEDFCGNFTGSSTSMPSRVEAFVDEAACQECADTSGNVAWLFIYTLIALLPLIASNVLRRFPNYDVNCQKTWAIITSLGALMSSFWAWYTFDRDCFSVLFRPDEESVPTVSNTAPLSWEPGPALTCMFCVSVLQFCIFAGHCLVPTPSICYEDDEQEAYEDQHRALQSVQHTQVIPDVDEPREEAKVAEDDEDDDSVYYDEKHSLQPRTVIQETLDL